MFRDPRTGRRSWPAIVLFWTIPLLWWLDTQHPLTEAPLEKAFWGLIVGWIISAASAIAAAAVSVVVTIAHTIVIVGSALAAFGATIASVFLKVWDFLGTAWSTTLKPFVEYTWKAVDSVRGWLNTTIGPVIDAVQRVRKYTLEIYDKWFRPVLGTIEAFRRTLQLLATFRLEWARELDRKLATLEDQILWPIRETMQRLNEVSNWLNRIVTLDGYLQRVTLIRSLIAYQADALKVWWTSVHRPMSPEKRAEYGRPLGARSVDAVGDEMMQYLAFHSGPDRARLDEHGLDLLLRLRALDRERI